jgi:hypothetical protein
VSNALQVYGILVLGWHFFPILYMWWWEEFVRSAFGILKLRRLRNMRAQNQNLPEVQGGFSAMRVRLFLCFIYFVFVVVMAGLVFAPKGSYIENLVTLVFGNRIFNLNLLLFIGLQGWLLWRDFYLDLPTDQTLFSALQTSFDYRNAILHIGLLAGALLSFLLPKFSIATEHAFMFGFMGIKTFVELWAANRQRQTL